MGKKSFIASSCGLVGLMLLQLVDRNSSTMEGWRKVQIERNHTMMNKFGRCDDTEYKKLIQILQTFIEIEDKRACAVAPRNRTPLLIGGTAMLAGLAGYGLGYTRENVWDLLFKYPRNPYPFSVFT